MKTPPCGPAALVRRAPSHLATFGRLAAIALTLALPATATVTIDWVTVGNINNAPDPATGSLYGSVDHVYRIARNETAIAQYAEFLNAVAKTDTYNLYNTSMATNALVAGISRSGSAGSYVYSVMGSGNRPITYVSWFDAARFCNWLHNGQPVGPQTALTTENGVYSLLGALSGVGFTPPGRGEVLDSQRERVVQGGLLRRVEERRRGRLLGVSDGQRRLGGQHDRCGALGELL